MPFNKEIEDFAQAFSSGYGMTKSKTEQESEALDLKHKQFVVDRDPVTAAQADESHAIEMQRIRGEISDAEAARAQHALLDPIAVQQAQETLKGTQTTNEFNSLKLGNLPTELEQGNKLTGLQIKGAEQDVAAKDRAVLREKIDNAHKDAMDILEEKHAKNLITNDEYIAQRNIINDKHTDAINALDETIKTHEAAPETLAAKDKTVKSQGELAQAEADKAKEEAAMLKHKNSIWDTVMGLNGGQPLDAPVEAVDPNLSGPRVRGKPVIPSLQAPTPSWGTTTPGPQSAVDVPPGSPSGSEAFISTHDDKSEGITKGAKNSPTAKTLRKLKNGEIPSMADYINVGTESMVDAAKSAADDAGIHKDEAVNTPGSELNFSNWLKGAHGADAATAQMAIDTVKEGPGGDSLSPQEAMLVTVAKARLAFGLAGMPEEALSLAKGMQGYAQNLYGQYAAFAQAAAAHGDVDATSMAVMKAYMHIGNGKSLDISPDPKKEGMFIAKIKDLATGKIEEQHVVTPDEIFAKAMNVTSGTSMEILNAAAGQKDETISDAAARVLAAEYKQYGLTAEEISKMTTTEFEKVQERLEKDIESYKPKKYTLAEGKEATAQIDEILGKFKESNADQIKALKLDDPAVGTMEDLLPAASQILLYNSETGMLPQRALRATLNLVVDGPSEPVMNLPGGRLLVSVAGVDPFVMSANEYAILTANRRKYGVPTASGLPPDAQRYEVGGQSAVKGTLAGAATAPGKGEYAPYATKPVGEYDPNAPDPIVEIFRKGVESLNRPGAGAVPYDMSGGSRAGPAVPVPPSPTGRPYISPNPADYPEELIRRGYPR